MSTPPSCSVRPTVPFPPGWEAAGSAGNPSVGSATQLPFPPGWAEAVTAGRGGRNTATSCTNARPSASEAWDPGRPASPPGWREAGGIQYRNFLPGWEMAGSQNRRRSGSGRGLAPTSPAEQTAMWESTNQIADEFFFDWCTGAPAEEVRDLAQPWGDGHVFGQGENLLSFGACAEGCAQQSPPAGGWTRLAVQARADTLCNEAALAAGWTCGYAKNISTHWFGGGCTVECEYGAALPCVMAAMRRQANLGQAAAACAACPTSLFQGFAHEKCRSSGDALTAAWCQPDTNANGTVDCHCFVSCDGGVPAQVEFCG